MSTKDSFVSLSKSKFIWRFPPSTFVNLPSCRLKSLSNFHLQPMTNDEELLQRQDLAILIYDLGSNLNVSFTCIYTGVIYMHRYFMLHSFQHCSKELVAAACLFLSCKINEMPRPLNEIIRHLHQLIHLNPDQCISSSSSPLSLSFSSTRQDRTLTSEMIMNYNQQIIDYENILLSTLGFCLQIEQPYRIITKISQKLSIPIDVAQNAQDIATKSILFTVFPMKYTTNLIACFALYLALTSSNINIPDNDDGSQWFHLLNEEFTEKLLRELVAEYRSIFMEKSSKKSQLRFEQIRQDKKINGETCQPSTSIYDNESHYPVATTSGSVRSTTSNPSTSFQTNHPNFYEQESIDLPHLQQTPTRTPLINSSQNEFSPTIPTSLPLSSVVNHSFSSSSSNDQSKPNFHQHSRMMSTAKPIPTLMSSSNPHLVGSHHSSRFATPIFRYPSSSSSISQQYFCPPPPPDHYNGHPLPHSHVYPPNYYSASSYYPQQQTPLFYHPLPDLSTINNKRYGEPPAPPIKRPRYSVNMHQPF